MTKYYIWVITLQLAHIMVQIQICDFYKAVMMCSFCSLGWLIKSYIQCDPSIVCVCVCVGGQ